MKIAHLADVHLGSRTYGIEETYYDPAKGLKEAIGKAIDEGAEAIVISGDLFHSRGVSPMEYLMAEEGLRIAKDQEVPVLAIHGNHDNPSFDKPSPYHVLENFELITFLDLMKESSISWLRRREGKFGELEVKTISIGPGVYLRYAELGEVAFYGIGFRRKDIRQILSRIPFEKFPGERKVLMLHQTIHEIFRRMGIPSQGIREGLAAVSDLPEGFSYYALGHLHKIFMPIKPHSGVGAYPGALCRLSVDDATVSWTEDSGSKYFAANERGFVIKNLEDSSDPRFVKISFRDLLKLEIREEKVENAIDKALLGLRECYAEINKRRRAVGPPIVNVRFRVKGGLSLNCRMVEYGIRQRFQEKILLRIVVLPETSFGARIKELEEIKAGRDPLEYAKQEVLKDSPKELVMAIEKMVEILGERKTLSDERRREAYSALKKIFFPEWEEEEHEVKEGEAKTYGGSVTLLRGGLDDHKGPSP